MLIPKFWNYGEYSSNNYGAHSLAFSDPSGTTFYFSYETLVAFNSPKNGLIVMKNYWGPTTGKHLNWIDGGRKEKRVDTETFEKLLMDEIV